MKSSEYVKTFVDEYGNEVQFLVEEGTEVFQNAIDIAGFVVRINDVKYLTTNLDELGNLNNYPDGRMFNRVYKDLAIISYFARNKLKEKV